MIKSVKVKRSYKSGKSNFVGNLPSILDVDGEFDFKPGLNIIVGANGSGKTSLLKGIAYELAALSFGISFVDSKWIYSKSGEHDFIDSAIDVIHDGQVVFYTDSNVSAPEVDLDNIGISADNLLFRLGSRNDSKGEISLKRNSSLLNLLEVDSTPQYKRINLPDDTGRLESSLKSHFSPKLEKGQPTIIMDEPESGLGILTQAYFWQLIQKAAVESKYQIILVSHSPQCLQVDGANYIELTEGYLDACLSVMNGNPLTYEMQKMSFSGGINLTEDQKILLLEMLDEKEDFIMDGITEDLRNLLELKLIDVDAIPVEYDSGESFLDTIGEPGKNVFYLTAKGKAYTKQVIA